MKETVLVSPLAAAAVGRHDHVVRIDAVALAQQRAERVRRSRRFPPVEHVAERLAA